MSRKPKCADSFACGPEVEAGSDDGDLPASSFPSTKQRRDGVPGEQLAFEHGFAEHLHLETKLPSPPVPVDDEHAGDDRAGDDNVASHGDDCEDDGTGGGR